MKGTGKVGIDLSGGLPERREHFFADRPEDPEMRDSASMWIVDDRGEFAIPRVGIEALSKTWDSHDFQVNVSFADGRVVRARTAGEAHPPFDEDGQARILGAGPLEFRCIEPYKTWTMSYNGDADETTVRDLIAGNEAGRPTHLEFFVEATMAVPPWEQGTLSADARDKLANTDQGDIMGRGERIEQLVRSSGSLTVDGKHYPFTGTGLRIKRQGVRLLSTFWGHAWQSALFPSGKGFGYIAYPSRTPGEETYNEGYIYLPGDAALTPARVVQAPWLRELVARDEDVSLILETEDGRQVSIKGTTYAPTHDVSQRPEYPNFPALFQGGVRYEWDGEVSYGMLERSTMRDRIVWPDQA